MGFEDMVGATYGPYCVRAGARQVAAYVAVTSDDQERWTKYAPPSFAGALLFAAAPEFLDVPEVVPYTRGLVHADQSFLWHRAVLIDESLTVTGTLSRIRERNNVIFATFSVSVRSGSEPVVDAVSTFLMSAEPSYSDLAEEGEPPIDQRGALEPFLRPRPGASDFQDREISASRMDLVRYAAASGDFNPVHFDHEMAVKAGFPGVLVHGLLMGAWVLQSAVSVTKGPNGIESAKIRFRNILRPAITAIAGGTIKTERQGMRTAYLNLRSGDVELVSARVELRKS